MTHNVLSETLSLYTTTTTFQNTKLSHYVDIQSFGRYTYQPRSRGVHRCLFYIYKRKSEPVSEDSVNIVMKQYTSC